MALMQFSVGIMKDNGTQQIFPDQKELLFYVQPNKESFSDF